VETQNIEIRLSRLIELCPVIESIRDDKIRIVNGIVLDSRKVIKGNLFVAIKGETSDGHSFIQDAVSRGAVAVVGTQSIQGLPIPYFRVKDSRFAMAHLSAALYGFPARKLVMIGVTGTDGKTTTANLLYQVLIKAGLRAGMITSVNAVIGNESLDTGYHVTTPEAPEVQRYLAHMVANGLTHAILEATSHGLAQERVTACDFDIGVVTNVTHEHLDYHGNYQAYLQAKGKLFSSLSQTPSKQVFAPRGAVLNRDDLSYDYLKQIATVEQISYGLDMSADFMAERLRILCDGVYFDAVGLQPNGKQFRYPVHSKLLGEYNIINCLATIAAGVGLMEIDVETVAKGIEALKEIPGRMERVDFGQDFVVIVDFAHTPNALRRALQAARKLTSGRVISVFGSAGLRDKEKRKLMASESGKLADKSVLTAEDPRTESLREILNEMAEGIQAQGAIEGATFWKILDRREAIRYALKLAKPGDVVIVCGKGHEQSMCYGDIEYPWDDRTAVKGALAELLNIPGPEMPFLPDWE